MCYITHYSLLLYNINITIFVAEIKSEPHQ